MYESQLELDRTNGDWPPLPRAYDRLAAWADDLRVLLQRRRARHGRWNGTGSWVRGRRVSSDA